MNEIRQPVTVMRNSIVSFLPSPGRLSLVAQSPVAARRICNLQHQFFVIYIKTDFEK